MWNQDLTVTAQLKSLPSGQLQDDPDGTQISVLDTAAKMISISDNTAANMLINLAGRSVRFWSGFIQSPGSWSRSSALMPPTCSRQEAEDALRIERILLPQVGG